MTMSGRAAIAGGLIGLSIGLGCTAAASESIAPTAGGDQHGAGSEYHRTELYFGSGKPDGSAVTAEEFQNFVDKEINPAFPDGLTEETARGEWRGASGLSVKETTFVVILLYPRSDTKADGEIDAIRTDYKRFFDQESVLRVDTIERVSF